MVWGWGCEGRMRVVLSRIFHSQRVQHFTLPLKMEITDMMKPRSHQSLTATTLLHNISVRMTSSSSIVPDLFMRMIS